MRLIEYPKWTKAFEKKRFPFESVCSNWIEEKKYEMKSFQGQGIISSPFRKKGSSELQGGEERVM